MGAGWRATVLACLHLDGRPEGAPHPRAQLKCSRTRTNLTQGPELPAEVLLQPLGGVGIVHIIGVEFT